MSAALKKKAEVPAPGGWAGYQLTVAQYHRMIRHGILTEDDPVELLEGYLVKKMPHNPPHDATITRIQRRLARVVSDDWIVRIQCAITTKDSEPEPDVVVASGPEEAYYKAHPGPSNIGLLIEVSDKTLARDRGYKARIYARAHIPIYWVVNLPERQIEVYTDPRGGKSPMYRQRHDYGINASVPLVLRTQVVAHLPVRQLIPDIPPADDRVTKP